MAEAAIEERQLLKALRWYDGFVIALCNPGFLIANLGYSIGALGAWGALLLWAISATVGLLSNWVFAEMAAMFPEKPGGIAMYAHEGWRKYFTLIGPISAFGYWIGWSVVLSINGLLIGNLVTQQWFSGQDWTFYTGRVHAGLPHVIAAAMIIFVWLINIFGVRPAVWVGYVTGALLMIPLFVLIVLPYLTGSWDSSNMQFLIDDAAQPWKLALVWLFLMCWSAYGIEICASFAPEYHDTKRDTALALRSAAMFSLGVYILLPLGAGGVLPTADIAANPLTFYVQEFDKILGVGAGVVIALLCVSLFLSMNSATADGGRALYGIARDDMTVKQLFHLNRYHVPARAMTVDLVVNLFLVFYVTSTLAILYISNIGYVAAHIFAVTGFLLLRRDRPAWPRAIRVSRIWIPIAVLIAAFNTLLLIVGITNPELTYAATWTDVAIGFGILGAAILLFLYRRIVQDKERPHWREETPTMPDAHQAKLLEQELTSA